MGRIEKISAVLLPFHISVESGLSKSHKWHLHGAQPTQLPCLNNADRIYGPRFCPTKIDHICTRFDRISGLHCIHRSLLLGCSLHEFLFERLTHRIPQESLFIAVGRGHEGRLQFLDGGLTHPPLHSEKSSRPALPLSALCCSSASEGRGHNVTSLHTKMLLRSPSCGPVRLRGVQFILQMVLLCLHFDS